MKNSRPPRRDELRVALFDVDGTLLKGSTSFEATWFLFKRGMVGPHHLVLALWYATLHGLGLVTYERIYEIGLKLFEGMEVPEVLELCRHCLEERVASRFFVGAMAEVQAQRGLGREIVLVSAGPRYLVRVIGDWIGADAVITAGPLIENGRVTDVLDGQVCSGEEKVRRVLQYLLEHDTGLEDCVYYGDSINDLPLLDLVGQPIGVNPDPRLKKAAASKGWKILRFSETRRISHPSRGAPTVSAAEQTSIANGKQRTGSQ